MPNNEREHPKGFDPAKDVLVDATTLRGIAHPLRPQILGLLRADGPSTATRLAQRLGLSSAATSYHLRQLATYGFVEEDKDRGTSKERWWRSVYERTYFRPDVIRDSASSEDDAAEADVLSGDYLNNIVDLYAQKIRRWVAHRDELSEEWTEASTMSDSFMRLTAAEAKRLHEELEQVVERYRDADAKDAPEDARVVSVQYQVFPQFLPGDES